MDEETFLELFHGSHLRTNQTLTNVGRWEPGVLARLLSFIDIVHALGFDIYQTNHYDYRIGKKDLHGNRGYVLCVLSFGTNQPILGSKLFPPRPLADLHLTQFNNRNNAILVNRGAGAAELFNMAGRAPHWPNQYI
jgi:hypothetical protein